MKKFNFVWAHGVTVFLVVVIAVGSVISPYFATTDNLSFVIQDVAEIAIIALAMTYLIIAGEIDLSVASTLNLASAAIGFCFRNGMPFEFALGVGLVVGLVCGLVNGYLVTVIGLPSLAVTIGTLALYRGLAYALLGNNPVNELPDFWINIGSTNIPNTFLPWSTIPLVILAAIAWIVLHYTRIGRWTFAIGINAEAAKFSGIPVARMKLALFAFTGLMSGVAGVVYTLRFASASPDGAVGYELGVIAAVLFGGVSIAGGVGALWGVLASVFTLGAIRSALTLVDFSANALLIVSGVLLLVSVVIPRSIEISKSRRKSAVATNQNKTLKGE